MNCSSSPLVSVIIPTFNHAQYLGQALESVFNQSYTNWEVIVVDNHSIDDTSEVVKRFSDPRLSFLKVHNNGVIAVSRNLGIDAAKGDWIAFLDSDDWWFPYKLETCARYFDNTVDLIHHDLRVVYEQPQFLRGRFASGRQLKIPVLEDLLTRGNAIINSTVVVRSKLLAEIGGISEDQKMISAEDYNAWLRIATLTDQFKYIDKSLGCYRVHVNGVSQRDMSIPSCVATREFDDRLTPNQLKARKKLLHYIRGRFSFLQRDYGVAEVSLKRSLSLKNIGLSLRALVMLVSIFLYKKRKSDLS